LTQRVTHQRPHLLDHIIEREAIDLATTARDQRLTSQPLGLVPERLRAPTLRMAEVVMGFSLNHALENVERRVVPRVPDQIYSSGDRFFSREMRDLSSATPCAPKGLFASNLGFAGSGADTPTLYR
jgi:hypothetical protein